MTGKKRTKAFTIKISDVQAQLFIDLLEMAKLDVEHGFAKWDRETIGDLRHMLEVRLAG